jgi:hypothetical protein
MEPCLEIIYNVRNRASSRREGHPCAEPRVETQFFVRTAEMVAPASHHALSGAGRSHVSSADQTKRVFHVAIHR